MLKSQLCVRRITGFANLRDHTDATSSIIPNTVGCSEFHFSFRLAFRTRRSRGSKSIIISCNSSRGSSSSRSGHGYRDPEYLEASVLSSETISHFQMQREGFVEETKHRYSGQLVPFSAHTKRPRVDNLIGREFLRRFQSPTIFLKISCDGDFLLPIVVGDYAIEKLIDALQGNPNGDSPDQFQFVRDLVEKTGYKVKWVKITERVVNTYFARLYFSKPGQDDILSVDTRTSDAINVACRCQVPIYVNKQIILADAFRIGYGMGRIRDSKTIYDVSLDSASDGPDLLLEELGMVRNMKLAIEEERYMDAAMWRDKVMKLHKPSQGH